MQKIVAPYLSKLLLTSLLVCAISIQAASGADRAAKAGELITIKNHRVLRLFGDDIKERGFAHGYLLAEEIRDDLDSALASLPMFNAGKYENKLLPWATGKFSWDADALAEMDGMFEGIQEKSGSGGLQSKVLGRALTRNDLYALNVIADYFGPACSGFVVCGKRSADGCVLHGRTLDFPIGPKAVAGQVIVASSALPDRGEGKPARKAWVCIGWPGLVAQFTGINADGLVVCIHDGYNTKKGDAGTGYVARGVLLRRVLESVSPLDGDPAEKAAKLAGEKPAACGNLFQLSWPKAAAEKIDAPPSAVLEFDGSDRKVDIRRMDDSGALVLTNHFRVRNGEVACERFKKISEALDGFAAAGKQVGLTEARKALMSAEQPVAAHSVYFHPDTMVFHLALTHENVMSPRVAPTAFTLKELFH